MAFPFDQAYKLLAEDDPRGAITKVAGIPLPEDAAIRHLDREINLERQHADQIYLISHEGESYIHHFEAVTVYRSDWREAQLEHAVRIERKYRVPVMSHLLLFQEKDTPKEIEPLLVHRAGSLTVVLEVNVIRLWTRPAAAVLGASSVALCPWTALMDATPEEQRQAAIRVRDSGREGLAIQMTLLGALRYGSRESFLERIGPMILTKDILRQSPMWQEIQEEGRAEGRQEGRAEAWLEARLEGERHALTINLTVRFGPLPAAVKARIAAADPATLDRWIAQAAAAESLDASLA